MNGFRIFTVLAVVATAAIVVGTVLLGARDAKAGEREAILAGGCFWCIESPYDELDGVIEAVSGYTGGSKEDATYEKIGTGRTGHYEAVRVRFDPEKISYRQLLQVFWKHIDPTDPGGQFADRGSQYRTAIFYHDEIQRRLAETTKAELELSGKFRRPIAVKILPAKAFYPAEDYHQNYCKRNEKRYEAYFAGSGRKGFLERHWGDMKTPWVKTYRRPPEAEIKKRLTPEEYHVTCGDGTERPFENAFWNKKDEGIYVDVISGEPLFSSLDKFKSGTGWPSFVRPLEPDHIVDRTDRKLGYVRDEVRSRYGNSHLGHVFDDGPEPTGLRYCINSAALRFIPKEDLMKEGYGQYLHLFRTEKDGDAKKK